MIKKNLAGTVLAAILICTVFTACANDDAIDESSSVSSTISSAVSTPENKPTASPNNSETPDADMSGTESGTGTALHINSFSETLRGVYGDKYYPDTEMSEEEIRSELGLTEDMYEEVYAEHTAQKAHPDTFIAVKVKEGQHEAVKEKLEAHKQRLTEDEDFSANADKLGAAKVYSEGDYVFLILLGDVEDSENSGDTSEGMAEAFGKEVQKGVDAIQKALGVR